MTFDDITDSFIEATNLLIQKYKSGRTTICIVGTDEYEFIKKGMGALGISMSTSSSFDEDWMSTTSAPSIPVSLPYSDNNRCFEPIFEGYYGMGEVFRSINYWFLPDKWKSISKNIKIKRVYLPSKSIFCRKTGKITKLPVRRKAWKGKR